MADEKRPGFREQIEAERAALGLSVAPGSFELKDGPGGEPFVSAVEEDLVALSLSGGGIRSATFNLGLLQGLAASGSARDKNLLGQLHYLSTVSGGGYIGGWWSAWRRRNPGTPGCGLPREGEDKGEIRHLREFSRFLAPRWGITAAETGTFLVALVSGLLPSLVATLAVFLLLVAGWHLFSDLLATSSAWLAALAIFLPGMAGQIGFEQEWRRRRKAHPSDHHERTFLVCATVASLTAALAWIALRAEATEPNFGPALAFASALLPLALARFLGARGMDRHDWRARRAAMDRVASRMLLYGLAWAMLVFAWRLGAMVRDVSSLGTRLSFAGATAGSGGLFAWAWSQIGARAKAPASGRWLEALRPLLPQALAYLLLLLLLGLVSALAQSAHDAGLLLRAAGLAILAGLVVLWFFDPEEVGLHAAYRARISRAYLGSAPVAGAPNRYVDELKGDDFRISALRTSPAPLHLICCAANDLAGDRLSTLARGARSATLSSHGFGLGDRYLAWDDPAARVPSLGSALTASAAAFNPAMGSVSMRLGPVVGLLLAALNLRLGLWVRRDAQSPHLRQMPGILFYRELFGLTHAARGETEVHLSDGGHFENLGLYELVRRRCRYIVASDCGQDKRVEFNDVGNALRRIRQDFGIEIEIDLAPLRPGPDGVSRQGVAVGEIRYGPHDVGILVLIKPAITGAEPNDVLQYRTRNPAFPHESTGDQFYDDAQWESYRRLGEHTAATALRSVAGRSLAPAPLFEIVRRDFYPTPPEVAASQLDLSERCARFEDEVRATAPPFLVREVFPELAAVAPMPGSARVPPPPTPEDWRIAMQLLLRCLQVMEDVWFHSRLDTHWSHPLNLGWMTYFQRWAFAPSFRMWWPVLRPIVQPGMRAFADERFRLAGLRERAELAEGVPEGGDGLAAAFWAREGLTAPHPDERLFRYLVPLQHETFGPHPIEAARAALQCHRRLGEAFWPSSRFYVPPSLWGTGIGTRFLKGILDRLAQEGYRSFRVLLEPDPPGSSEGDRRARLDLIGFYRHAGFRSEGSAGKVMVRRATAPATGGT